MLRSIITISGLFFMPFFVKSIALRLQSTCFYGARACQLSTKVMFLSNQKVCNESESRIFCLNYPLVCILFAY